MKKNHKNDKRRITARERADAWLALNPAQRFVLSRDFARHARAAVTRYKRKQEPVINWKTGKIQYGR